MFPYIWKNDSSPIDTAKILKVFSQRCLSYEFKLTNHSNINLHLGLTLKLLVNAHL